MGPSQSVQHYSPSLKSDIYPLLSIVILYIAGCGSEKLFLALEVKGRTLMTSHSQETKGLLPHPIDVCFYHRVMCCGRAYLGCSKQGELLKNALHAVNACINRTCCNLALGRKRVMGD